MKERGKRERMVWAMTSWSQSLGIYRVGFHLISAYAAERESVIFHLCGCVSV